MPHKHWPSYSLGGRSDWQRWLADSGPGPGRTVAHAWRFVDELPMGLYWLNWCQGLTRIEQLGPRSLRHIEPQSAQADPANPPARPIALGCIVGLAVLRLVL